VNRSDQARYQSAIWGEKRKTIMVDRLEKHVKWSGKDTGADLSEALNLRQKKEKGSTIRQKLGRKPGKMKRLNLTFLE